LFLEGVEVPVVSAQVNAQPDRPATASVQIIPSEMGMHILPRTLVHLFFLDPEETLPEPGEEIRTTEDASIFHNLNRFDALDSQYKLMFVGEVIGFNFGKNPSSRQLILQCMDLSSYWDTCYQWYADYSPGGGGLTDKTWQFAGGKKGVFNSISGGTSWVVGRLINTKPKNPLYKKSKGLLAGIIHVLEVIGGLKYKSSSEPGNRGVNDFFTIAELRYNLTGMIGAVEKDDTSAKLYQNKAFRSWLKNGMTSLGTLVSFRNIINHVNQFIFHNIYPQVCPRFLPSREQVEIKKGTAKSSIYTDRASGKTAKRVIKTILFQLNAAQNFFDTARKAASTAREAQAGEAERAVTFFSTKAQEQFELGLSTARTSREAIENPIELVRSVRTDDRSSVVKDLEAVKGGLDDVINEIPGRSSGNLETKSKQALERLEQAIDILNRLIGPLQRAKTRFEKEITLSEGAHLFTQLILPELFFVAPPNCNVIFPDQYFQFSFSRNFMREVSRLMCRGGNWLTQGRRGAKIFGQSYYAPETRDITGKLVFLTRDRGSSVILPHEVHSGIIPKFEWVTDGHRWSVKAVKETGATDKFQESGKTGYIQRLANFQFYLHRFSARSISLSGMFNPNLVLGFPAVIFDRPMPAPAVAKQLKELFGRRWLPMAYLGKVATLTHNITQQGGLTNVSLTKCRTHRGLDDEFLGTLTREISTTPTTKSTRGFVTKRLLEPGRNARQDNNREQLRFLVRDYVKNQNTIPPGTKVFINSRENRVLDSRPSKKTSFFNLSELVDGFGLEESNATDTNDEGDKGLFLPTAFKIDLEQGNFEIIATSAETALYPGFYSPVYLNDTIGSDVYNFLLGTRAITDDISLNAKEQDELLDKLFEEDVRTAIADSRPGLDFAGETTTRSVTEDGVEVTVDPGSIEEAIDAVTMIYGLLRHRGGDVHGFIKDFTSRPIATLEEVLGSQNLEYDDNGDPVTDEGQVEGFHSRAFGNFNTDVKFPTEAGGSIEPGKDALHALYPGVPKGETGKVTRDTLLDKGGAPLPIAPELDPRGRAQSRVQAYVNELSISRGLVG
jgi:hypothetical protein